MLDSIGLAMGPLAWPPFAPAPPFSLQAAAFHGLAQARLLSPAFLSYTPDDRSSPEFPYGTRSHGYRAVRLIQGSTALGIHVAGLVKHSPFESEEYG